MLNRKNALHNWLVQVIGAPHFLLTPLTGDASFRRYFRLSYEGLTRIVMDAPPDKECLSTFIKVGQLLHDQGVQTPQIYAQDEAQGFALLEDLGDHLLLDQLSPSSVETLYRSAFASLLFMQECSASLPLFDAAFIGEELTLFRTWFLERYLTKTLSSVEEKTLATTFAWLSKELLQQPSVFIHRDFHSRNMMVRPNADLAIIDFQDAMRGPFTYDLVSLLKDCYIKWPRQQVLQWVSYFHQQSPIAQQWPLQAFIRAFDLCGLQRHLKVLGIFCRLCFRDGKATYLNDLPLTLHYVLECTALYPELEEFHVFMKGIQLP